MRETKWKIVMSSFYDHTGIAAQLEKLAAEGWMLEEIGGLGWKLRRTEPRKLHFSVSYYAGASLYDPEPSEGELDFRAFCARTGWKLAAASGQMQIFYNEQQDPIPIETDPALEVENIHRAARRSFLPSQLLLLAVMLLNLGVHLWNLLWDPLYALSNGALFFASACFLLAIIGSLVELGGYYRWRARARQAAACGEFLPTPDHRAFQWAALAVLAALVVWFVVDLVRSADGMQKFVFALMVPYVLILIGSVWGMRKVLRRKKVSAGVNRVATVVFALVLSVALMAGVFNVTVRLDGIGLFNPAEERYTWNGHTFTASHDALPLTVEDLLGTSGDGYSTTLDSGASPILARFEGTQRARLDAEGDLPRLRYTVVEIRLPLLYDWCRDRVYREKEEDFFLFECTYAARDPAPWGANEAWERVDMDGSSWNEFLLCYDRRVVVIQFDWAPTAEQMALTGERLGD